jgi:hypothetical protein
MKKQCTKCKRIKPIIAFSKKRNSYSSECKFCHNIYHKNYYKKNKQYYLTKNKEKVSIISDLVKSIKEGFPCADCNYHYPACVMDFDHVIGIKLGDIGTLRTTNATWEVILNEIAKCEIVCSNCHRMRTEKRRSNGR